MQFLQSPYLIGVAAVAVPIVVHLIFRRQARLVEIGSIRFLRDVVQRNRRKRTISQWLLLALRMAAVCLLAVLFARPYLVTSERVAARDQFVVLVDRSATMQLQVSGERLVERARRKAAEIVGQAGSGVAWAGADFDHDVWPWSRETSSGQVIPAAPANLVGGTSYSAALAWGLDRLRSGKTRGGRIHLLTDLQRSGIDVEDLGPWPSEVKVELHDVGKDLTTNLAVTSAQTVRAVVRPGDAVHWEVTVLNTGSVAVENIPVRLVISAGGATRRLTQEVTVPGQQSESVRFELTELEEGVWTGEVNLDVADDLVVDNRRLIAVLVRDALPVLLVDGEGREGGRSGSPSDNRGGARLLHKALSLSSGEKSSPLSPFHPMVISANEEEGWRAMETVRLITLCDVGEIPESRAVELASRVKEGAGLLILAGPNSTAESCRSLSQAGLIPGQIVGQAESKELPFRLRDWREDHPLLEPFRDPQYGDLRRLAFRGHARLVANPKTDGSEILASFQDGDPALVEKQLGAGRVLWLATDCGPEWGAWVRSRLFVPLVHQLAGDLVGLTGEGPLSFRTLGERDAGRAPGIEVSAATTNAATDTGTVPSGRTIVTNLAPQESETERCTPSDLAGRYGFALDEAEGGVSTTQLQGADSRASATELRDDELWPQIAGWLCLILGLELFLGNRTTR